MNKHEALNYLGIQKQSDAFEALEEELFLLRQFLISKGNIPQLLIARKKKLSQLKEVATTLNSKKESRLKYISINKLESSTLINYFNSFENNKALIFQQLSSKLDFEILECSIDNLILNLKMYSSLWPEFNSENKEQVLLSKELDRMEMLAILKELESKGICEFSDLNEKEIPETLIYEIKRLNALKKQFIE